MDTALIFRERLRNLRTERGVSQKRAAEELGITDTGYRNYEYGTRSPTFEILPRLASYFKVSADYLLGLSDEPRMPDKEDWAILKQIYKAREDKQDSPKE